jgi:preprotein translocase subunit SecA
LAALSNDELRAKTTAFKEKIKQARAEKDAKIAALKRSRKHYPILIKEKIFITKSMLLKKKPMKFLKKY